MNRHLTDLATVLAASFPDRDFPPDAGPETRVLADLGLASIELIVLGEKVEQFYGRKLPYAAFLRELRGRGADDLTLGELADFLARNGAARA